MDPKIKSDFIPDQSPSMASAKKAPKSVSAGPDFLTVLVIIVLIVNIALAVGVGMYKNLQESTLEKRQQILQQEKQLIKHDSIQILSRLDQRLKGARVLLENHTAVSVIFDMLERLTLKSIYFNSFSMVNENGKPVKLSLQGSAKSVNSIALQADILGKNKAVIDPVFSNLAFKDGGMEFKLDMLVDRAATLMSTLLSTQGAGTAEVQDNFQLNQ